MFKRLENEMKPTKNYQLYREKMQKLKKENIPLLPWLGTSQLLQNCSLVWASLTPHGL